MTPATRLTGFAVVLFLLAGAGYVATRLLAVGRAGHAAHHEHGTASAHAAEENGLRWLRTEYALDDATWTRIEALHRAYYPKCAEMCGRISEANERVAAQLRSADRMTPEVEAALRAAEATHADCRAALLRHIYEVAALMPPDKARRYLDEMGPRLIHEGRHADDVMAPAPAR